MPTDPQITAMQMAKALRGSLENGCGITVKDFDILIAAMLKDEHGRPTNPNWPFGGGETL